MERPTIWVLVAPSRATQGWECRDTWGGMVGDILYWYFHNEVYVLTTSLGLGRHRRLQLEGLMEIQGTYEGFTTAMGCCTRSTQDTCSAMGTKHSGWTDVLDLRGKIWILLACAARLHTCKMCVGNDYPTQIETIVLGKDRNSNLAGAGHQAPSLSKLGEWEIELYIQARSFRTLVLDEYDYLPTLGTTLR